MSVRFIRQCQKFRVDQRGATAVEYGLMIALITLAILGTLQLIGPGLARVFDTLSTKF